MAMRHILSMQRGRLSMADSSTGAKQAIDSFLTTNQKLSFFHDFDQAMSGRQKRLPPQKPSKPSSEIAWHLWELTKDHFYVLHVSRLKIDQITRGILWAITEKNITVHLALTRSLLEHVAAMAFQVKKLSGVHDDLAR